MSKVFDCVNSESNYYSRELSPLLDCECLDESFRERSRLGTDCDDDASKSNEEAEEHEVRVRESSNVANNCS